MWLDSYYVCNMLHQTKIVFVYPIRVWNAACVCSIYYPSSQTHSSKLLPSSIVWEFLGHGKQLLASDLYVFLGQTEIRVNKNSISVKCIYVLQCLIPKSIYFFWVRQLFCKALVLDIRWCLPWVSKSGRLSRLRASSLPNSKFIILLQSNSII